MTSRFKTEDDAKRAFDRQLRLILNGDKPDFEIIMDIETNWNDAVSPRIRELQLAIMNFTLEDDE